MPAMSPLKLVMTQSPPQPIVLTSTPLDFIGGLPGSAWNSTTASQVPASAVRSLCSAPGFGAGGGWGTTKSATRVSGSKRFTRTSRWVYRPGLHPRILPQMSSPAVYSAGQLGWYPSICLGIRGTAAGSAIAPWTASEESSMRTTTALGVFALIALAAAPAAAQGRRNNAQGIPPGHMPRAGE